MVKNKNTEIPLALDYFVFIDSATLFYNAQIK